MPGNLTALPGKAVDPIMEGAPEQKPTTLVGHHEIRLWQLKGEKACSFELGLRLEKLTSMMTLGVFQ